MNKTEKDSISETMKRVMGSEKSMDLACEALFAVPEIKVVVDFFVHKNLSDVIEDLFRAYRVDVEGATFYEMASMVMSKKLTFLQLLGQIKEAWKDKLDKEKSKKNDKELADEVSEELLSARKKEPAAKAIKTPAPVVSKTESQEIQKPAIKPNRDIVPAPAVTPVVASLPVVAPVTSPVIVVPEPARQSFAPAVPTPSAATSWTIDSFSERMHGKIQQEALDFFVKMGNIIRNKFLTDNGDFSRYWNELCTFMVSGQGTKMMNEWKGKTPEFLVISVGYVLMKRVFKDSKTVKVSKIDFHNAFEINPRSCFRALDKTVEYLGDYD
jgi:hypothetical protein